MQVLEVENHWNGMELIEPQKYSRQTHSRIMIAAWVVTRRLAAKRRSEFQRKKNCRPGCGYLAVNRVVTRLATR